MRILRFEYCTCDVLSFILHVCRTDADSPGICGMDLLPSVPFGPYLVNDKNSTSKNDTFLEDGHNDEDMWQRIQRWITKYWKVRITFIFSVRL